ncbi:MAG: hypothetical protein DCC75_09655 [Proteobacteria bacterium]|nr:MAG: hypothetical protein DCC75_09655 [Pseudomonadota bacterium]
MSEANEIELKVFIPSGLVLETRAHSVVLPASTGEIGILPLHARYIGLLGTGILHYQPAHGAEGPTQMVITGGFCNFSDGVLVILADSVDLPDQIMGTDFTSQRGKWSETVQATSAFDPEWQFAQQQLARIEALEKLVQARVH